VEVKRLLLGNRCTRLSCALRGFVVHGHVSSSVFCGQPSPRLRQMLSFRGHHR
jgi:hypothetical protein